MAARGRYRRKKFRRPDSYRWRMLPLARHRIEDGKYKKCDCIKLRFNRLLKLVGLNGKRSYYCLRKSGATLIEAIDPAATEMYLAHSEKGMKRAYAERDWGRLEWALMEMEKLLPFASQQTRDKAAS